MIRHIVFFRAKNPADRETIFEGLSLLTGIPDKIKLEVSRNMLVDLISPDGPDFVVYGEFADEAQLATYKSHPLYQKSISIVRPLRDMRIAADTVSEPA
jgi:Stress responsive A/B Barrel Domain